MGVHDFKTESLKRRIHPLLAIHASSPQPNWPATISWDWLKHITEALSPPEFKGDSHGEHQLIIDGALIGCASPEFCRAIEMLRQSGVLAIDASNGAIRYTPS